ncbi:unnamed protein product, partial [Adineta steineri]
MLNLGRNQKCAKGAQYLASVLKKNRTLTILDLGWNYISDAGAHYLAYELQKNT